MKAKSYKETIIFYSDRVKVKTGRMDNGAVVEFSIGEYQLKNIKELIGIVDKNMEVIVKIESKKEILDDL